MLELKNITKTYRGSASSVRALEGISLSLKSGDFLALQGPSGCGKTTLLLIAGGLLSPDSGQVLLDGSDLYSLPSETRAQRRAALLGFVFQEFHLIPYLSVLDNVLTPTLAVAVPNARERAKEILDRVGLRDRYHFVPAELSTGQQQRVAFARAIFNRPRLLLADEPTGNLDRENAQVALQSLAEFAAAGGAVLLVTHNTEVAQYAKNNLKMGVKV